MDNGVDRHPEGLMISSVIDQIWELASIFQIDPRPALKLAQGINKLPMGANGLFAILEPQLIPIGSFRYSRAHQILAKEIEKKMAFSILKPQSIPIESFRYSRAHQILVTEIEKKMAFGDSTTDFFMSDRLALTGDSVGAWRNLVRQRSPIKIVGGQLGSAYYNRSIKQAEKLFRPNEFGFDVVGMDCIVLTNPGMFEGAKNYRICVPGVKSVIGNCNRRSKPCVFYGNGKIGLGLRPIDQAGPDYGSATGFLLQ